MNSIEKKIIKNRIDDERKLIGVHHDLEQLYLQALDISPIDFKVMEGLRTEARQKQLFKEGKTKTMDSKHLKGKAIDIVPVIDGDISYAARDDIIFLSGLFYCLANKLGIKIRVGSLWNNNSMTKNTFIDAYHIELV